MLRVGILINSDEPSAWIAEILRRLQAADFATIEVVLARNSRKSVGMGPRQKRTYRSLLFTIYEKWDYDRYRSEINPFASTEFFEPVREIPLISVEQEGAIEELRRRELDVLLSFATTEANLRRAFRYGALTIHHGGAQVNSSLAFAFWPMYRSDVATETSLVFQKEENEAAVHSTSFSATDFNSLYCNRAMPLWKTVDMVLRTLRELDKSGAKFLKTLPTYRSADAIEQSGRYPRNYQMLLFLCRWAFRSAKSRAGFSQDWPAYKWFLGIRRRTSDRRFDDPSGYTLIACPKDRFYADPFILQKDGRTYIYFEDFRYSENKACISFCELFQDGTTSRAIEVVRRPYHLSYPFIFEDEGTVYMVPESKGGRNVELLKAIELPHKWASVGFLMEGVYAVDTIIKKINGKYWMFSSLSDGRFSNCDELSLFYADKLEGPWRPHPKNPLISDVRRARSAGALFYDQGRLIRPSQDCGKSYGYGLVFSEIVSLSETEYEERTVSVVNPVTRSTGNHTYNRTEGFEVIDRLLPERFIAPSPNID